MFLTKPYKILPFSKRQNQPKENKNSTSHMFNDNSVSPRSHIIISAYCLQSGSKITSTPSKSMKRKCHALLSKKYSQEYF